VTQGVGPEFKPQYCKKTKTSKWSSEHHDWSLFSIPGSTSHMFSKKFICHGLKNPVSDL
jgi:hypothetical protein